MQPPLCEQHFIAFQSLIYFFILLYQSLHGIRMMQKGIVRIQSKDTHLTLMNSNDALPIRINPKYNTKKKIDTNFIEKKSGFCMYMPDIRTSKRNASMYKTYVDQVIFTNEVVFIENVAFFSSPNLAGFQHYHGKIRNMQIIIMSSIIQLGDKNQWIFT
jgi:hypothetical protein